VLAVRASPLLEVHKLNNNKMKVLKFIVEKKESYKADRVDLKNDYKTANKLGFNAETVRIERDIRNVSEILEVLEEVAVEVQKERTFTETEISQLQSAVHKITGDGEVMQLFNSLLGVNAGGGS
jgi:hypothetical protein